MHAGLDDRLHELLQHGRLEQLEAQLAVADERSPGQLRHYRAELAFLRGGPLIDLLRAVRAPEADQRDARFGAELIRRAAAAGAMPWARAELALLQERWPAAPELALVAEQLAAAVTEGSTRAAWQAACALVDDDARAAELYQALTGDPAAPLRERLHAHAQRARWLRVEGEFSAAAAELDSARALAPAADEASFAAFSAALDHWLAGAGEPCLQAARELREAESGSTPKGRWLARAADELLSAVEQALRVDPSRKWLAVAPPPRPPPKGDAGRILLRWILAGNPGQHSDDDDHDHDHDSPLPTIPLPTIAHLRRELEARGLRCWRLRVSPAALATLAAEQARVVLEEERPTATGLQLLAGYEAVARVLLLCDPQSLGAQARLWDDHRRRSALHAQGALVVLGRDAAADAMAERLAAAGLAHDQTLELADLCDVDRDGSAPPHARVAQLAEDAMAADAALPMPHKRRGEALLAQLALGHPVEDAFERWLLDTRRRFPDAEWPFQSYAGYLERSERVHEAIVAWGDAAARDPQDERNLLGQARGLLQVGRRQQAEELARKALLRRCGAGGETLLAQLALERRQWALAESHVELALALAPGDPSALLVGATAAERCGRSTHARALLEQAAVQVPADVMPRLRLLRHHVDRGAWGAASDLAEQIPRLAPAEAGSWHAASSVLQAAGEVAAAAQAALQGLQRCGGGYELVERAVACLPQLAPELRRSALAALGDLLAGTLEGRFALASELAEQGLVDEALALGARTLEQAPHEPSAPWALARLLLAQPTLRETQSARIDALLVDAVARGGGFPYPIGVLGWRLLERDPARVLELIEAADASVAPALVLDLAARACDRLGRSSQAQALRQQLVEVLPDGALGPAALLRLVGEVEAAVELLLQAQAAGATRRDVGIELARALRAVGRASEGLAAVQALGAEGGLDEDLAWALLELAEAAADWPELERAADFLLAPANRDTLNYADPWPLHARRAGARLALGDDSAREAFCAGAPLHVQAHALLWRLELRQGKGEGSVSARLVAEHAPSRVALLRREAAT